MAQQYYTESDTETCDSDDSQQDPSFDVLEDTQSKLSNLSIKKKSRSRLPMGRDEDADRIEIIAPEFDANENKSFDIVKKIIEDGQVEKLKVDQCKLYLRRHGLRLTGKKDVLIHRIKEHLSIINGEGEHKYPASSFVVNCKGDACTGDVVMFEQNVYEMFSIASRSASGPPCGQRIVAGRIVKESYGAAKQQHTFTIEVLWSKGTKPLPPLHPLLIKGRNLYRLKTMRQRWEDESERQNILSEKHARGNAARTNREVRLHEKEMKKALRESRASKGNIKSGKQENKKKASPTRPVLNSRTSIQQSGAPLTSMDHGAPYKENLKPNALRDIDGPLRKSVQVEQNRRVCPPRLFQRHDYDPHNLPKCYGFEGIDGPLRKSFQAEQNTRFYPPRLFQRHDYDPQNLPPISYGFNGIDGPLRKSSQVEENMGFYPPKLFHRHYYYVPQSLPKSYGFQDVSKNGYSPRGHHPGKRQQLCRYYAQGGCHHGSNCKYLH